MSDSSVRITRMYSLLFDKDTKSKGGKRETIVSVSRGVEGVAIPIYVCGCTEHSVQPHVYVEGIL